MVSPSKAMLVPKSYCFDTPPTSRPTSRRCSLSISTSPTRRSYVDGATFATQADRATEKQLVRRHATSTTAALQPPRSPPPLFEYRTRRAAVSDIASAGTSASEPRVSAFTRLIGAARIVVDFRVSPSARVGAPPRPSVAEQAKLVFF